MVKFITVTVFLAGVLITGKANECNEKDLAHCLEDVQKSVLAILENPKNTDKKSYCESIMKDGKCMTEASENCRKKQPKISIMLTSFEAYLKHMCTEDAKVYMEMTPCFETHRPEFEKCHYQKKSKTKDPLEAVCNSVGEKQCEADLIKKLCENGEAFANGLEKHIDVLREDVCPASVGSNLVSFGPCYSILALIFILLSNRNRF